MRDKVDLVLVDEVNIQHPWCILDHLIYPSTASKQKLKHMNNPGHECIAKLLTCSGANSHIVHPQRAQFCPCIDA